MNALARMRGWSCRDCGKFNSNDDFTCECAHRRADREEARWERSRHRWAFRDEVLIPALFGQHHYRARRYVGGIVRWRCEGQGLAYFLDVHRIPGSVLRQSRLFFEHL